VFWCGLLVPLSRAETVTEGNSGGNWLRDFRVFQRGHVRSAPLTRTSRDLDSAWLQGLRNLTLEFDN
jgi:hypothetical protein